MTRKLINKIGLKDFYASSFKPFVIPEYETAPFSTIQNRAPVTRSLKAVMGTERVHVKSINPLQNEFGPNGEQVFEAGSKDSRIRFIGNWELFANASGSAPVARLVGDSVEVTFYGTGLNLLTRAVGAIDLRASVDGGAEGANFVNVPNYSGALDSRNYPTNQIVQVVSGLTNDWHTVRIRVASLTANSYFYAFEILNERTDIAVYSGQGMSEGKVSLLDVLETSPFNLGVTGTKGARVVKYIANGELQTAVTMVDATARYLTSADHTNETAIRRINFREFGVSRADDFSTLAGTSSRAFTLDDGTTTLVGSNVAVQNTNPEGLALNTVNSFITITFVGTGLDWVVSSTGVNAMTGTHQIFVDGVSIASGVTGIPNNNQIQKICSGLPYGTHTVRLLCTASNYNYILTDFIIYRPKTPAIPSGAFVVAKYNVNADYVVSPSFLRDSISTGVLRKSPARERTYVGAWSVVLDINHPSGLSVFGSTAGMYLEFSFFGTGVEIKGLLANASAINRTYSIDGSTNLTGYTIGVGGATGLTFTAATGVLSGTPTTSSNYGETIFIRGLPLGHHVLRATFNSGYTFYNDVIDVITPIHAQEVSLKVGSMSMKTPTLYAPEVKESNTGMTMGEAKAWMNFDMVTGRIISSMNISQALLTATGIIEVYFERPFKSKNYVAIAGGGSTSRIASVEDAANSSKKANNIRVTHQNISGVLLSDVVVSLVCFGELIEEDN